MASAVSPILNGRSSVLAVIPHYRCEQWLGQAIESLVSQHRPPEAIAVMDDGSPHPPIDIVAQFPRVTLLAARENVGPFPLIQAVIDRTRYDAYLQQDADDWSTPDRLQLLLEAAERTGAELVGTHSLNITESDEPRIREVVHPEDASAAYRNRPIGWYLTWGTSIASRALMTRIGGLSTGIGLVADSEFVQRAQFAATIANVPRNCYYRRKRTDSLTGAPETGFGSAAREQQRRQMIDRTSSNAAAVARGEAPDLTPLALAPPVVLEHLLGPIL